MRRRTLLAGLGSLVASGSLAVGTGAFSTTRAERTVSVSVADDADALLSLEPLGEGFRSEDQDDEIQFSFPGLVEQLADDDLGLGPNSVYEFERDSGASDPFEPDPTGADDEGLVKLTNRGTQPVTVTTEANVDGVDVELYAVDDPDKEALSERQPELGVGEPLTLGFRVYTFDEVGEFSGSLTITATATD